MEMKRFKYEITGIHGIDDVVKVKGILRTAGDIKSIDMTWDPVSISLTMAKRIPTKLLNERLATVGKYKLYDLYVIGGEEYHPGDKE